MCGIGGVLVPAGHEVDVVGLQRMGSSMAARGPDAEGLFIGPGVGLIHRRLSILDLSELGNCPMPNEDGSIQVLLNGEIYQRAGPGRSSMRETGALFVWWRRRPPNWTAAYSLIARNLGI